MVKKREVVLFYIFIGTIFLFMSNVTAFGETCTDPHSWCESNKVMVCIDSWNEFVVEDCLAQGKVCTWGREGDSAHCALKEQKTFNFVWIIIIVALILIAFLIWFLLIKVKENKEKVVVKKSNRRIAG